ncbi:protein of unknown function [Butyrivibrio proteoclasticus]|uniref:DarT domain-containing protein n=1 Tax=Butyrivibrio proteoclasticus TaxID=43305 RepID=A0A1I5Q181_9FIRM|nr:DarT ssDNA thymidine ADP-ribosyltransferase family protein [Butyrivibrio proteoclasticus]SFP39771.1 protein of unknown function [Butyrivibrio proteoclasticus]
MYSDIIKQNMANAAIRWWPKYAYHFTDIRNAVNILALGRLYSRIGAKQFKIMKNDNASKQVIDMTSEEVMSFVRFYFRPLTPTQYHNEGYKHRELRYDSDDNANIPVPIFLFFDLQKVLEDPSTRFSELGQAGHGNKTCNSEEEFAKFDFEKIYNPIPAKDEVAYKHAEIIYPDFYDIDRALVGIACRTELERQSLLNMLQEKNRQSFYKYKDMIRVVRDDLFEYNGLFVTDCDYDGTSLAIRFSDTKNKYDYAKKVASKSESIDIYALTTQVIVEFEWHNRNGVLFRRGFKKDMPYLNPHSLTFSNIPTIQGAKDMSVKVYFDSNIVCFMKYRVNEGDVL